MGRFSDELSNIMSSRGISPVETARAIGVSRASFFKYKSGSRLPAEEITVQKLAETLQLNHDEKKQLLEAYLIEQIGEYKYRGMKAVERLLTMPVAVLRTRQPSEGRTEILNENESQTILSGQLAVRMRIFAMISEGIKKGDVTIFETVSNDEIFRIVSQVKAFNRENEIIHIMAMNGSENVSVTDRLYNVECMGRIFMTLCSCEGYRPLYYYASLSSMRTIGALQTNIIMTDNKIMCYKGDLSGAVIYRESDIREMYVGIISEMRRISSPYAEKKNLADSVKAYMLFRENPGLRYSFIPGLCLTSIIEKTDDLLVKNVRHELEGVDLFFAGYEEYWRNFQADLAMNKGKHHYVVSGPGIRFSYENGLLNEFPKEATIPLDKKGTAKLVRRFRRASAFYDFRVLDDERFPAENTIGMEAVPGMAMVSVILPGELAMRVILIREQSTAALINDYLTMLYENRALGGDAREQWYEKLLAE